MNIAFPMRLRRWRLSAVAVACAAVLGTTALGTMAAMAEDQGAMHGPMDAKGWHGSRLDRFKAKLKLTPDQSALWDQAVAKMHPPQGTRERMHAAHEAYVTALMDPGFDPRKWLAREDQERTEREARMKDVREAWLSLWDKLDSSQRTQVREFLVQRGAHGGWGHHWRDHDQDHGGERGGSEAGHFQPPAPTPNQ